MKWVAFLIENQGRYCCSFLWSALLIILNKALQLRWEVIAATVAGKFGHVKLSPCLLLHCIVGMLFYPGLHQQWLWNIANPNLFALKCWNILHSRKKLPHFKPFILLNTHFSIANLVFHTHHGWHLDYHLYIYIYYYKKRVKLRSPPNRNMPFCSHVPSLWDRLMLN